MHVPFTCLLMEELGDRGEALGSGIPAHQHRDVRRRCEQNLTTTGDVPLSLLGAAKGCGRESPHEEEVGSGEAEGGGGEEEM